MYIINLKECDTNMHVSAIPYVHTHIAYYNGLEENIADVIQYRVNIFGNLKWRLCGTVCTTKMLNNK
jgi:hypothetical protein